MVMGWLKWVIISECNKYWYIKKLHMRGKWMYIIHIEQICICIKSATGKNHYNIVK